jgi:hypothetical protein
LAIIPQSIHGFVGLPKFYGYNMDAWIDCMTCVDAPADGMTTITVGVGDILVLSIENALDFQGRCPTQYQAILDGIAFVNFRRTTVGNPAVLALMPSGN